MPYLPKQGDIIFLDFDPQSGHEQAGRRPAVVMSNNIFHARTNRMALVAPITNTTKPFPTHVPVERTKTTGVIMCEQIKSVDVHSRRAKFVEELPEDLLERALNVVGAIFEKE
ncbi:MAG: type II toxin-antitoxin system PemK/MazF family toxin [Clostridia bacterium]|nr:type II toxin-antitoxin system PemK/MazF family toxin [Clostridia bacterium]